MSKDINKLETNLYVDKDIIPIVDNSPDVYLHKTTMLYGGSESGKTVLTKHILHLLKDSIPQIIVISPTNKVNKTYTNVAPSQLIYDDVSEELFQMIYEKQTMARQVYDKVQKIEPLYDLFKKCANSYEWNNYKQLSKLYKETKTNLDTKVKHIAEKKSQLTQLKEEHQKTIRQFFKQIIRKNRKVFETNDKKNTITKEDRQIIKYIDYNPNLLLLFDDCAARFKQWGKIPGVTELFFNGRHFYVTTLMSFQSDTLLPPDLRNNAHISIFTTKQCALSFFDNKKNGISKQDQKKFSAYADEIFSNKVGYKNYKKLCYFKYNPHYVIQYILANLYDDFRFGSKALWDYCDQIKKEDDEIDTNNTFYERFNS